MTISRTYQLLFLYGLVVSVVVLYSPSLTGEVLQWNDAEIIESVSAAETRGDSVWKQSSIYPLPRTVYSFFYGFGDGSIFLFHLANILLHATNVVLLFLLLGRIGLSMFVSIGTSLLFGLHPLMAGTVAWLSQFPIICSVTFLLCFIHAMVSYTRSGSQIAHVTMWLSILLFHLTVPGGITVPVVIAGMVLFGSKRENIPSIGSFLPFLSVPIFAFVAGDIPFSQIVADTGNMVRWGIVHGFVSMITGFASVGITPVSDALTSGISPEVSWYPLAVPFVIAAAYLFGKDHRTVAAGMIGYVALLLPIVHWNSSSEWVLNGNNFYAASPMMIVLIVIAIEKIVQQVSTVRFIRIIAAAAGVLALFSMVLSTHNSVSAWKTNESFWSSLIEKYPDNRFFLNAYGTFQLSKVNFPKAIELFSAEIEHHPDYPDGYISRGYTYLNLYQTDKAKSDFYSALRRDSGSALAYYNLGMAYSIESSSDSALDCFSRAIERNPDFAQAYNNRANVFGKRKSYVRALADYEAASRIDPLYADIFGNRGLILLETGNATGALINFKLQSQLSPYRIDVWIHYSLTGMLTGDTITAKTAFLNASDLDSTNAKMYLSAVVGTFFRDPGDVRIVRRVFGIIE